MAHLLNKLPRKQLIDLLEFTLNYFKGDVNYKIDNGQMIAPKIEEIKLISEKQIFDDHEYIMEGISINGVSFLPIAISTLALKGFNVDYKKMQYRELLTYLTVWGLQIIYETQFLKKFALSTQTNVEWGISKFNENG